MMSRNICNKNMKELPIDWKPTEQSVICGRGRGIYNSKGNQRFRELVSKYLSQYVDASGQVEKSKVVKKVLNVMQEICPEGAFVKHLNGRYCELSESAAHEKCSATFRDLLNAQARSYSRAKKAQQTLKNISLTRPIQAHQRTRSVISFSDDDEECSTSTDDSSSSSMAWSLSSSSVVCSFYDIDTLTLCNAHFEDDVNYVFCSKDVNNEISLMQTV